MDSPAFEDRHAVLHPQHRLVRIDLREQEPGPAAVARMGGEQFAKGGAGRRGQMSAPAKGGGPPKVVEGPLRRAARATSAGNPGRSIGRAETAPPATREDLLPHDSQRFCSTFVLISRLAGGSQSRDSGAYALLVQEPPDLADHLPRAAPPRRRTPCGVQSSSTALSRSCSSPRAERGAISPSRRDQNARCGTGGLSVMRGIGGSSTVCPATRS